MRMIEDDHDAVEEGCLSCPVTVDFFFFFLQGEILVSLGQNIADKAQNGDR